MAHEADPFLNGCEFAYFFTTTPEDLVAANLYGPLAITFMAGAHRHTSLSLAAKTLGAVPRGRATAGVVAQHAREVRRMKHQTMTAELILAMKEAGPTYAATAIQSQWRKVSAQRAVMLGSSVAAFRRPVEPAQIEEAAPAGEPAAASSSAVPQSPSETEEDGEVSGAFDEFSAPPPEPPEPPPRHGRMAARQSSFERKRAKIGVVEPRGEPPVEPAQIEIAIEGVREEAARPRRGQEAAVQGNGEPHGGRVEHGAPHRGQNGERHDERHGEWHGEQHDGNGGGGGQTGDHETAVDPQLHAWLVQGEAVVAE